MIDIRGDDGATGGDFGANELGGDDLGDALGEFSEDGGLEAVVALLGALVLVDEEQRQVPYILEPAATEARVPLAVEPVRVDSVDPWWRKVDQVDLPPEPAVVEIPDTLDGRVVLFNQALVKRDMALLTRLTDPAQHRPMRIWLGKGAGIPAKASDEEAEAKAKIVGDIRSPTGDRADVRVVITTAAGEVTVQQQWAQRTGVWYFQPVKIRSAAMQTGPVKPYSKHR